MNLCRAHTNRHGLCLPQPDVNACRPARRWRCTPIAYSTSMNAPAGSQAAPGCIPRRPASVERSIPSDPDRRGVVVPQRGTTEGTGAHGANANRAEIPADRAGRRASPCVTKTVSRWAQEGRLPYLRTLGRPPTLPRRRDPGPAGNPVRALPGQLAARRTARHHCCPWLGSRSDRPLLEWGRARPGHGRLPPCEGEAAGSRDLACSAKEVCYLAVRWLRLRGVVRAFRSFTARLRPQRGPCLGRIEGTASEDERAQALRRGDQLGRWVWLVQGGTSLVGKRPEGARQT